MERTEIVMNHLIEEWDNVVVLCSRYNAETGGTELFRIIRGNHFAIGGMIDECMYNMGGCDGEEAEDEDYNN